MFNGCTKVVNNNAEKTELLMYICSENEAEYHK